MIKTAVTNMDNESLNLIIKCDCGFVKSVIETFQILFHTPPSLSLRNVLQKPYVRVFDAFEILGVVQIDTDTFTGAIGLGLSLTAAHTMVQAMVGHKETYTEPEFYDGIKEMVNIIAGRGCADLNNVHVALPEIVDCNKRYNFEKIYQKQNCIVPFIWEGNEFSLIIWSKDS